MLLIAQFRSWFLLAVLQLGDIATTAYAINVQGARESGRVPAALMASYGQPVAYVVKAVVVAVLILALWHYRARSWSRVLLWVGIALSAMAVINNVGWIVQAG